MREPTDRHAHTAVRDVLGHKPQAVVFDGETWNIVCECQWETSEPDEWMAWDDSEDHVTDDVRTVLRRGRDNTKVVVRINA